uniref:Uncharacterized protein n=1 Tax=Ixodes ricinus TaxID=34613 RepID=A0A6B0V2A2_IXORI
MFTWMLSRKSTLSMSLFWMATCRKLRPLLSYCSAAVGSLAMMVSAARLLRVVMATAKGVSPCLSLRLRFMEGCPSSSEIITEFWLVMATCRGVFPSESWALTFALCSMRVCTTDSRLQAQERCRGVCPSYASSSPSPWGPGRRGLFKSHPLRMRNWATESLFSSMALCSSVWEQPPGPSDQQSVSQPYWTSTEATSS